MIQTDAIFRTFFIKAGAYGTAFVVKVENKEYLVTAKHLLENESQTVGITVNRQRRWDSVQLEAIGYGRGEIDIAVFRCPEELQSAEFELQAARGEFGLGQDMWFLGFPYKLSGDLGNFLDGLPCAFVKKGTLAFFDSLGNQSMYLDAINNEGFSGGPILFYPQSRPNQIMVAGVVSKFRTEYEPVLTNDGGKTEMSVAYNTGLLHAYGMKHVLEIVRLAARA